VSRARAAPLGNNSCQTCQRYDELERIRAHVTLKLGNVIGRQSTRQNAIPRKLLRPTTLDKAVHLRRHLKAHIGGGDGCDS
jgi:hypothetical protein